MEVIHDGHWICQMAGVLACEILQEMAEIRMERCPEIQVPERTLDAVYGLVDGDYQLELLFQAEPKFFVRLATSMIGDAPEDEEEVQEYAREYFNTLCGRFISEIYQATKRPARFYPIQYKMAGDDADLKKDEPFVTIYLVSDCQEYAQFSWTRQPMEDLLRRIEHSET